MNLVDENQPPVEPPPAEEQPSVQQPEAASPVELPPAPLPASSAARWPSAVQFGLSLFAILLLVGSAGLIALFALAGGVTQNAGADVLTGMLTAASIFGIGLLLIPSAYYSLFRLMGRPAVDFRPFLARLRPIAWLLLYPPVVLIGLAVSNIPVLSWLILPVLHLLAIGIPVAWLVYMTVRGLPLGSSQRMWGVLDTGLALAPLLISLFELLAIGAVAILAIIYISGQPEIVSNLMQLAQDLQNGVLLTEEDVLARVGPYLLQPVVVLGALAVMAVIIPLIEEALKPLGVWLLAGRRLSARAGFAYGALSGAGFALTESLLMSTNTAGGWGALVVVRAGTGAIHILTAALTGWALALAWKQRRYGRLLLTYLTAVTIHGMWNGLSVLTVFAELARIQNRPEALPVVSRLAFAAPLALVLMVTGALVLLIFFNRKLARRSDGRNDPGQPEL